MACKELKMKATSNKQFEYTAKKHTSVFLWVTVILLDLTPSTRNTNSAPTCKMYRKKIAAIRKPSYLKQLKTRRES